MRPIDTVYRGYRFRSRLEARWAVFFDALGIQWTYEAEGYVTEFGQRYLPDFEIDLGDQHRIMAEVKPRPELFDQHFIEQLVDFGRLPRGVIGMVLLPDIPSPDAHPPAFLFLEHSGKGVQARYLFFTQDAVRISTQFDKTSYWSPGLYPIVGLKQPEPPFDRSTQRALRTARSARFEHGESP